jgi:hypothetical protein
MPGRQNQKAMAIEPNIHTRLPRRVAARQGSRPVVAVVRSLLMVALAALVILGLLPAVVGVAAAP